jgi:hypothetical protein
MEDGNKGRKGKEAGAQKLKSGRAYPNGRETAGSAPLLQGRSADPHNLSFQVLR